jgi:hypothetical protein
MNATLFSVCPVPICSNPVDDGELCAECLALIGDGLIRRVEAPGQPAAEAPVTLDDARRQLAGQLAVESRRAAAQESGDAWKPGQRCWVCEQRRSCRLDPGQRGEWICRECEAIQP